MAKVTIDWSQVISTFDTNYTGDETNGYVSAHLVGVIFIGKLLGLDTSSLETKAQNQYNVMVNNGAVFDPQTVPWLRNLPMLSTTDKTGHISPNTGTPHLATLYEIGYRYVGFSPVTDIPKASEILDNWPIEASDYYGTGAPRWCGRVNSSGNGLANYNANNQNIGFVSGMLIKGLIDGSIEDTLSSFGNKTMWEFAKDYLDAWKSYFPTTDAWQNDVMTRTDTPLIYWQITLRSVLEIINILHMLGVISDTDLATYLDWTHNVWRSAIMSIDWSTHSDYANYPADVSNYWVGLELVYKNLRQNDTMEAPTGVTWDTLVNNIVNHIYQEIHKIYCLFLINNRFGIIIKRPAYPKAGDTITIIPWGFAEGITISGDGINFSETTIPQSGATVTITSITKQWWRIIKG